MSLLFIRLGKVGRTPEAHFHNVTRLIHSDIPFVVTANRRRDATLQR